MALSMLGYVFNDTFIKLVGNDLGLFQSIFIRGIFASILIALIAWHRDALVPDGGIINTVRNKSLIVRVLAEVAGTFFFIKALFNMPIANVTAILQVLPLTITLGAAVFFGEAVGWRRYLAILVGFIGVLLIVQPGSDGFNIFALSALAATVCVTIRDLATKNLPTTTNSVFVSMCTAFAIFAFGAIGTLFEPWQAVKASHVALLFFASIALVAGYIFSVLCMRSGEVSFTSPFRYSILIWALLIGYFVFGDVPDLLTLVGAVVIVASGLFTFYRERVVTQK